ncbi:hypothetical protein [Streptomyces sp. NPDC127190]|uniref:hypothetical protein n=1 Tax=unclassified Streptomyces TaxID=2593676 RepID=UPI0036451978
MRIQAALVEAPAGPFTVRDVDIEPPRPDEILVRVTAAGIGHTDLTIRVMWPGSMPSGSPTAARW